MEPEGQIATLTRNVEVRNKRGLHARAAAKLVSEAERYGAEVMVIRCSRAAGKEGPESEAVSARSIMGLLMLGAGMGSHLQLRAEGWDAKEALDAIMALIESKFHEQE